MLILGYDILECPHCSQLYKKEVIASGNIIGSTYYSDSYLVGPFIPEMPTAIRCINKACEKFFLIKEARKIAYIELFAKSSKYDKAYCLLSHKMGIEDLKEFILTDYCKDKEQELTFRIRLLRRYNDKCREDENYKFSGEEYEPFIMNIEKLIELHTSATQVRERLFIAELYREKGDFDSCIEILDKINLENENQKIVKEKIYSQAKVKDDKVFNIDHRGIKKEYKCTHCGHGLILFDLDKLINHLDYKHFRCKNDNKVFDAPLKMRNPKEERNLFKWRKLMKKKKPYEYIVDNDELYCPVCKSRDIELFDPESQKCVKCGSGDYEVVKWFD